MNTQTRDNEASSGIDCSTPFTAGPWTVVRSQTCGHLRAVHNYHSDPRNEWTDADLALIAAAPDLFATLVGLRMLLDTHGTLVYPIEGIDEAMARADRAIEKALT